MREGPALLERLLGVTCGTAGCLRLPVGVVEDDRCREEDGAESLKGVMVGTDSWCAALAAIRLLDSFAGTDFVASDGDFLLSIQVALRPLDTPFRSFSAFDCLEPAILLNNGLCLTKLEFLTSGVG